MEVWIEHFTGDGELVFKAAIENGLEGVIAKRTDSIYEPGKRSKRWLKIKGTLSDEFVIGGFSAGQGNRAGTFGALLLGQYNKGKLVYTGHVGTGFDEPLLNDLLKKLAELKTETMPFKDKPPLNAPTTWVRPELAAEVKFAQRTDEGLLRAPVFLRLREDKPPGEVRRTEAVQIKNPPQSPIKKGRQKKNRDHAFQLGFNDPGRVAFVRNDHPK
jgi:bifunctional non-homologous end joining protein LigD